MKYAFYLFIFVLVVSCSDSGDDPEPPPPPPPPPPPTELPGWVVVENPNLGTITVSNIPDNPEDKAEVNFEIEGSTDNVNWLFLHNDVEQSYNFEGDLLMVPSMDTIDVIFVDGLIDINIPNTNIYYRYNFEWVSDAYTQEFVVEAVDIARDRMANSNAEELIDIFNTSRVNIYFDGSSAGIGHVVGDSIVVMNVVNNFEPVLQYASQIIHEYAHLYEFRNPEINDRKAEIYANATWQHPDRYYAISDAEMFACGVAEYIVSGSNGSHEIMNEPYYTSAILPFIRSLFEAD